jgi:glycosyltransferase involved in cell wall biosynthesis
MPVYTSHCAESSVHADFSRIARNSPFMHFFNGIKQKRLPGSPQVSMRCRLRGYKAVAQSRSTEKATPKASPTRVLVVTHYFPEHRGGVELIAQELGARLVKRGFEIVWAASNEGATLGEAPFARLSMKAWNFTEQWLGFAYPLWGAGSLCRLYSALRHCHVVHIHDSLYMGNIFAYMAARVLGKPIIVTQHVGMVPYSKAILRALLTLANHTVGREVLGGCNRCIFISKKVQKYFSIFVNFNLCSSYIPNGVISEFFQPLGSNSRRDLRTTLGLPANKPIMLFVGRFVERKGLKVLRLLVELFTECFWVFIGWGPLDPADWRLPNVYCPGPMEQVQLIPYFQSADLLVLPSVGEGFPAVVQQAMACGTPALVSDDTALGMPEVESLLYVADVAITAFAAKLCQILDSCSELERRRDTVATFARNHWDWEICADAYSQILKELT